MYDIVLCVYERFRVDGLKRYVNDDRFRVDGVKNMLLLAFAFTIVFVWTAVNVYFRKRCENADVRCQCTLTGTTPSRYFSPLSTPCSHL